MSMAKGLARGDLQKDVEYWRYFKRNQERNAILAEKIPPRWDAIIASARDFVREHRKSRQRP